jgi:hypothetical protein
MKKIFSTLMIAVMAMASVIVLSVKDADAVPSFARQTQQPCLACHFQHIPKLNAMGRAFKLGGMTDTARDVIGDNLVLDISPFSMVFKSYFKKQDSQTYTKAQEIGGERGEYKIPDEMEAFFAGRVADKVGAMAVIPFSDGPPKEGAGASADAGKLVYSDEYNGIQYGASLFFTGGAGPFFAMELFNTGLQRAQRAWENRTATVACQKAAVCEGEATGLGLFAANEWAFGMIGPWVPKSRMGGGTTDIGSDWGMFYRAALTPTYNNWDLMLGVFGASGTSVMNYNSTYKDPVSGADRDDILETYRTTYFGIDGQAQGSYGDVSIEVRFNAILDTTDTDEGGSNMEYKADATGFGGGVDIGFMEDLIGLKVGAMTYDDASISDDDTYFNIGGWWNIYQDLRLMPEVSFQSDTDTGRGYDSKFYLTLFTAW